ncbi:hypothetical protein LDENG_00061190 [Lucifuga dentata]|nr:hypothetical protein LDENG_00061190 [Lucifuga dentata]
MAFSVSIANRNKALKQFSIFLSNSCTEGQVKFSEGSLTEDVICANASRNHYCFSVILPSLLTVILIVIKVCSTKQR